MTILGSNTFYFAGVAILWFMTFIVMKKVFPNILHVLTMTNYIVAIVIFITSSFLWGI